MVEGQVFRLKDVLEAANLLCHDRLMKPLRQVIFLVHLVTYDSKIVSELFGCEG